MEEGQQQHIRQIKNSQLMEEDGEEESPRSALSSFQAREEEIERKKMEVKEKVFAQLCRVEQETKHLAMIRGELEAMVDPTRNEAAALRKKIDAVNRALKPLGQSCLRKLVSESERLRMRKLEELNKSIDFFR
ncbi:hypothetical protein C4D60_Mb03t19830 [Musa balbisiana]|uniref:RAB6-interacting golgin n=1 Tax=Musa balbisiana TaxID=52838 RepID=A0A4V4H686_MUSBA|nr:hypothetical protein C4D60_Mb03t19830 [Musa balbisiana]